MDGNLHFSFENISKKFGKGKQAKIILKDAKIDLMQGECILLSGKNGSGKSTLMRILAGLLKPDTTLVQSHQQSLNWKQAGKMLRQQIMYLYQEPYMFDGSVSRNLGYAINAKQSISVNEKIKQALQWADLEHRKTTEAKCLSGGEKQRLALAQAWLKQPPFLLLDEPTANMDKHAKRRTGKLLAEFKKAGTMLLIASHDLNHLLPIMDRRLILEDGKLINAEAFVHKQTDRQTGINMSDKQVESCADDFEPSALGVDEAREKIIEKLSPVVGTEKLALRSCLGRYLAEDVISPINVPSHVNSAMDGYALAGADLPTERENEYQVVGIAFAGTPSLEGYQNGQVTRIMTGGVMPAGTDTVIMQEQVEVTAEKTIRIQGVGKHKAGQNVRQPGEDIAKGSTVLGKGRQITPADLGILASFGVSELLVYRRPRVAFFSTGDELRSIGETLGEGEIYDSNRYTLFGMLKKLDVEILDMGVIADDKKSIRDAFIAASEMADFVITSGGVSVGEADYIKPTLKELGDTHFWKIRMKPGRPLTFGTLNQASSPAYFFGLPGNPVAVMVTFMQFVQPAINYFASGEVSIPMSQQARCTTKLYKRAGRTEFQRGILEQGADGALTVKRTGKQGSGILTSMSIANCFIILPEKSAGIEEGDIASVQLFPI